MYNFLYTTLADFEKSMHCGILKKVWAFTLNFFLGQDTDPINFLRTWIQVKGNWV